MTSFTIALSGQANELHCSFFPEIMLDPDADYYCALLELITFHSLANVNQKNNQIWYKNPGTKKSECFKIPTGTYEAETILEHAKAVFASKAITFEYRINKNTLKVAVKCSTTIELNRASDIFVHMFGFKLSKNIEPNIWTEASKIVKISSEDVIRVKCNIVSGSFVNGKPNHIIHEFSSNKVDVGYKIVEQPKNLIYLPVNTRRINYIELSFVDQENNPIDFRGENITCRIHIKKGLN